MAHLEFVLVLLIVRRKGAQRSVICLVELLGISLQMDLDPNYSDAASHTRRLLQSYVAVNCLGVVCDYGPAVIHTVNDLWWHTALGFSIFNTYHATTIESKALTVWPADGVVITAIESWVLTAAVASAALTPGVISESRATVETIKAFEVNCILYGIYLEVDLWVRNGLDLWKKVANAGDFKYSSSTISCLREEMLP